MLGALAEIVAVELVERAVRKRRRRARGPDRSPVLVASPFGPQPTCRECKRTMLAGSEANPRCGWRDCPVGRENERTITARNRARAARQAEVRQPPRNLRPEPGTCSLCAGQITAPRRKSWCGPRCVDLWTLATTPAVQMQHLRAFFDGCWQCGQTTDDDPLLALDVEHVRPLWSLSPTERLEIRWWLPFNLQLLCSGPGSCHAAKTKREAAARARRGR